MTTFIIVIMLMLVLGSPASNVSAKKHKTGTSAIELGAHDATQCTTQDENNCGPLYITQPGKGFADHSKEFNKNYIKGYCAAGEGGSDADEATFDSSRDNN
jgi:hypothetical protein